MGISGAAGGPGKNLRRGGPQGLFFQGLRKPARELALLHICNAPRCSVSRKPPKSMHTMHL